MALAREHDPNIRCFTIKAAGGQEEGAADDLPYVRRVAQHFGVPFDVVQIAAGRTHEWFSKRVGSKLFL